MPAQPATHQVQDGHIYEWSIRNNSGQLTGSLTSNLRNSQCAWSEDTGKKNNLEIYWPRLEISPIRQMYSESLLPDF